MASLAGPESSVYLTDDQNSSEVRDSFLEHLSNISQCSDRKCTESECVQLRSNMDNLMFALRKGLHKLDKENTCMLKLLHEHYACCCEPSCHVPWCRYLSFSCPKRCQDGVENTQEELMMLMTCPMLNLLPQETQFSEFIKLDPGLPDDIEELRERDHWLALSPLSLSYTGALALPLISVNTPTRWVVKMAYIHEDRCQLQALKKLRDLQHPHIVRHIWAAACYSQDLLVLCTEFIRGISVRTLIDTANMVSLLQTQLFLMQVLSALKYLHNLNLVFLNLICSNLILDQACQTVKLTNFSSTIDLSSGSGDTGMIKLMLPSAMVPFELLTADGKVTHKSDMWGLGCMMHEMLVGNRPWHHLRHSSREHIWKEIQTKTPPDMPENLPQPAQLLIQSCLQRNPDSRLSVSSLMEHIHAHLD